MVRLRISLVIFLTGCIPVIEIPIEFQIESGISNEGVEKILPKKNEANSLLGYYYGEDILVYNEKRYTDLNGFDLDDLTDGRRIIYQIVEGSDIYKKLRSTIMFGEDFDWTGEALFLGEDMILVNINHDTPRWDEQDVLHEFGHWFGMMHRDDPNSVMRQGGEIGKFSLEDIQAFCLVQDCEISPF